MGLFGQQAPRIQGLAVRVALAALGVVACSRGAVPKRAVDAGRGLEPAASRPAPPAVPPCQPPSGAPSDTAGTLRVHLASEPPHLNPQADSLEAVDRVTRGLVYETLIECVGGDLLPALAESWTWSAETGRLELALRAGVTWHDGRSFTAIDVQASVEASLRSSSRLGAARASLAAVRAVELVPGGRLRLRLDRPAPGVLWALCDLPIVPARLVRGGGSERERLARNPVGTGPFRFVAWQRGARIKLAANPRPWGRRPLLAELLFELDPDPASALRRLRRGELELLPRLVEADYPEQVSAAALGPALRALRADEPRWSFVAINHRRPVLQDLRVRQALDRLWNRARLAADLHRELAEPITAIGPRAGPAPAAFSPGAAAQLLAQAGLVDRDNDRFREHAGERLALSLLHADGSPAAVQAAGRFALDAARAGLRIQVQAADPGRLPERLRAGDFDLALVSWRGRSDEDLRPLFGQGGAYNHGAFHSPAVEALLDEVAATLEPQARSERMTRLAAALAAELPVLFLLRHQRVVVAARAVRGLCHDGRDLDLRSVALPP